MRLWLIRHAKSSWANVRLSDVDRPLNKRGKKDGARMQRWLAKQPFVPAWIWTSDAARARATAKFVHRAFPNATLVEDRQLYGATPETILSVVRATPAEVESVAVVAHNPGMTQCVNLLAGERVLDNLPTFGIARLQWFGDPREVAFGQAIVETLMVPKWR